MRTSDVLIRIMHEPLFHAHARGFDNAVVCDALGNVAKLTTSNLFMTKDGIAYPPLPKGTFLSGINRRRVIGLLRDAGMAVIERILISQELGLADEIFSTGNHSKVVPITRIDGQFLYPSPIYTKARELYWSFAHSCSPVHL